MKLWLRRLEELEKKAMSLHAGEQLDQWIKEHVQTPEFLYLNILSDVPNHLKMLCLDKAIKQLRENGTAKPGI